MGDLRFRLDLVEAENDWVIVCTSPFGGASTKIRSPFAADGLRAALSDVEKALIRSSSPVITRRAALVERTTREFGERLTDAVLTGDVRLLFERCREQARAQGVALRVLLAPVGPNLSRIPWEFAVDPAARDAYLALRLPVVRSPQLMEPAPPFPLSPPLRVLGVISRPADLPVLEAEREREEIAHALQGLSSDVAVEWLPGDSWQELADAARTKAPHVLHFVGHGGFDEETDSGYIELTGPDGTAMHVSGTDLGTLVRDIPQLRLVVLNACESATCGADGLFTSTAARIMKEGVPAVVAMQYEITDPAALAFASSFYTGIARGLPVDRSMTLARENVKMTFQGSLEWATPVLFLASEEPQLFVLPDAPAVPPPPPYRPYQPPPPAPPAPDWQRSIREKWQTLFQTRPDQWPVPQPPSGTPSTPPQIRRSPVVVTETGGQAESVAPEDGPAPGELQRIRALPALGPCCDMALGPKDLVAAACADGAVRVLRALTGDLVGECVFRQGGRPLRLAWSPWPRHVASLHEDGSAVVWDIGTEVPVRVLRGRPGHVQSLAFSADGRWLATAGSGRFQIYDANGTLAKEGPVDRSAPGSSLAVGPMCFAPDGRHLVIASVDGSVRQLDVHGRSVAMWPHPQPVTGLASARDRIATGIVDGQVRVWSWNGQLLHRVPQSGRHSRVEISADGAWLAVVADDRSLVLWDGLGRHSSRARLCGQPVAVGFLAGQHGVLTGTQEGIAEIWPLDAAGPGQGDGARG
jgi:hypothetical protein